MAISSSCPNLPVNDFSDDLKIIVLLHLDRPRTLKQLTDSINDGGYLHLSEGQVHAILKKLDRVHLVTVVRKLDDDFWTIQRAGVNWLRERGAA